MFAVLLKMVSLIYFLVVVFFLGGWGQLLSRSVLVAGLPGTLDQHVAGSDLQCRTIEFSRVFWTFLVGL